MFQVKRAIKAAGGITALANAIGVTPQVVVHWRTRGVPAERVKDVVRASSGKVTPHDLAPELFPEGFEFPAEEARAVLSNDMTT